MSTSMVGRILTYLKRRGMLREPPRYPIWAPRGRLRRPYGVCKPKDYQVKAPVDLVQVDTLDLRPLSGVVLKQFTARDVVCRWDVLEVRTRASATTATQFLDTLKARLGFPLRALQVDGGSEFMAGFEEAPQGGARGGTLRAASPQPQAFGPSSGRGLNGHVERANRTHTEEFYEVVDSDFTVDDLKGKLLEWEAIYNTVRPHQALGYITPQQFLQCYEQRNRKGVMCH